MAKSRRSRRPVPDPQGQPAEGGRPNPPHRVEAEQAREVRESQRASSADASKSVKKKHTGGR